MLILKLLLVLADYFMARQRFLASYNEAFFVLRQTDQGFVVVEILTVLIEGVVVFEARDRRLLEPQLDLCDVHFLLLSQFVDLLLGGVVLKLLEAEEGELVAEMGLEYLERAAELVVVLLDGSEPDGLDLTCPKSHISDRLGQLSLNFFRYAAEIAARRPLARLITASAMRALVLAIFLRTLRRAGLLERLD